MTFTGSKSFADLVGPLTPAGSPNETHGTTVLAVRFDKGAIVIADRRATMGSLVMYDKADKIVLLDDRTVVAVSGAYARSLDVCRYLKHSFKYYERLNLAHMSTEGKLSEISRALVANLPAAMDGNGLFVPIAAAYDQSSESYGVYFFDPAGARFSDVDYACAGSGSERVRGVFEYLARTKVPWHGRPYKEVLADALAIMDIASDLDAATGGFRVAPPMVVVLGAEGATELAPADVQSAFARAK